MSPQRRATLAELFRRLFATGAIALVFGLTVLAASPVLHNLLHSATESTHDDACPVVLFAHGVITPSGAITAPLPPVALAASAPLPAQDVFFAPPRHLRQPERGPPARV